METLIGIGSIAFVGLSIVSGVCISLGVPLPAGFGIALLTTGVLAGWAVFNVFSFATGALTLTADVIKHKWS